MKSNFCASIFLVSLLLISLMGCNEKNISPNNHSGKSSHSDKDFKLNEISGKSAAFYSHEEAFNKIIGNKPQRANSWSGKWFFTIQQKDRNLVPETIVGRAYTDEKGNIHADSGKLINSQTINPNEIVYIGYTSLDKKAENNFDIVTNAKNAKIPLSNFQIINGELQWQMYFRGDLGGSLYHPQQFSTTAVYDAKEDRLYGETKFWLEEPSPSKKKYKLIPMGEYRWEASRIEEKDFQKLTRSGYIDQRIPIYLVGIDTNKPSVKQARTMAQEIPYQN